MSDDQVQATHTEPKYGNINDTFTAEVWIEQERQNTMIAHIRIGEIQLAVGSMVNVLPEKCKNSTELFQKCMTYLMYLLSLWGQPVHWEREL